MIDQLLDLPYFSENIEIMSPNRRERAYVCHDVATALGIITNGKLIHRIILSNYPEIDTNIKLMTFINDNIVDAEQIFINAVWRRFCGQTEKDFAKNDSVPYMLRKMRLEFYLKDRNLSKIFQLLETAREIGFNQAVEKVYGVKS